MNAETRHLTAVHGDVAGYSKLTSDNEIETHATLRTLRRIIEEEIAAAGGEVVQFVGDEFLAIVPGEAEAFSAAPTIQRRIAEEIEALPAGRKMRFRLGVNAGEISVEDGQWFGDAINIAARLQAMADPGGVTVSAETLDAAGDVPYRVEPLGRKRLKNIPEPVSVFSIVDDELVDQAKPWRRRLAKPAIPSIAVSPFVNLGDESDSHFADGLMMGLVISLMRIPGLDVISETSSLGYRDHPFSAAQIGHEMGVQYVLEGAVQRSGDTVRVMTQVLDVEQGATVWADRFEAGFDDVFSAQDDIVFDIVEALDIEVIGGEVARMYRTRLDPASVENGYRGLQDLAKGTADGVFRAIDEFAKIVDRQPDAPSGYMLTALAHLWMAIFIPDTDLDTHYAEAERFAVLAVEREDQSGIGQTVLAHAMVHRHDWDGALEAARLATSARPSCDLSYGVAASVMRYVGEVDAAVEYANRAIRLSPLFSAWYESIMANAEFLGGNYDAAAEIAEGVVAMDEAQVDALLTLAAAQSALGRQRHATAALDHAKETRPGLNAESLRRDLPYRDPEALARFIAELEASGLE